MEDIKRDREALKEVNRQLRQYEDEKRKAELLDKAKHRTPGEFATRTV